ncbi:MAG: hypothetical protein LKK12_02650 [Bacteroidales bacterium]|nr:hypothetical protein [Bacteroidales bacterium]MCI2133265.1 hypothetical protein [Bacteroidales bacterium]
MDKDDAQQDRRGTVAEAHRHLLVQVPRLPAARAREADCESREHHQARGGRQARQRAERPKTLHQVRILYKYLAKKINRGGRRFSPDEIIGTLQDMNFLAVNGEGYVPTYTRTDVTNNLHGSAGFRTDTQIVSKQRMNAIIAESKKSTKKD